MENNVGKSLSLRALAKGLGISGKEQPLLTARGDQNQSGITP